MNRIFRYLALAMAFSPLLVSALDLPVKTVNGKQYYYYVVKKGDTLYSLATRFDITRNDIVEYNPGAADYVRIGQTLYFPVDRFGDGKPVSDTPESSEIVNSGRTDVVFHQVRKGETLYGISRKYDVDVESIIALNPSVRGGVKAGTTLRIPMFPQEEDTTEERIATPPPVAFKHPVTTGEIIIDPNSVVEDDDEDADSEGNISEEAVTDKDTAETSDDEDTDSTIGTDEVISGPSSIAVLLPFMLDAETPNRQAMLYTDFYKGLLVAADSLSQREGNVSIYAYDTMGDMSRLASLLSDTLVSGASVIIAPSESEQLSLILRSVDPQKTKVLNVFNVRDSSYVSSPASVQVNLPQRRMYARAMEAIDKYYPSYTPVFLKNETGRTDKAEFINYISDIYRNRGIEPIEIVYDGALLVSQLEPIPDDGRCYLLIPASGSLSEFNKISHALGSLRNGASDASVYALFGYPDWTAFRNDAEQMLHTLGATVYSRFYYNEDGFDARCLNDVFERWFGCRAIEVVPHHGMLGFDVGNMLLRNIRHNNGYFIPDEEPYDGVQTGFRFVRSDNADGGYINDDIYILRFAPNNRVERLPM